MTDQPNSNVRQPTGWPRAATPCDLKPRWAGEFRDFNDWVNFATSRLAGCKGSVGQDVPAICVDAKGRRCHVGKDFHRARDEDAFPIRYFWECAAPADLFPDQPLPDVQLANGGVFMTAVAPRPFHEWHEDYGPVLWWLWPIEEAPYVGTPLDLGRSVSFDITVQIGVDLYEVEPKKIGDTGGWPWADVDDETEARLFWSPLPDADALDVAIRDYIRGGPDPFQGVMS